MGLLNTARRGCGLEVFGRVRVAGTGILPCALAVGFSQCPDIFGRPRGALENRASGSTGLGERGEP